MSERPISRWADKTENGTYWFTAMADVRRANEEIGNFWFSPDTLQYFDSIIGNTLIGG